MSVEEALQTEPWLSWEKYGEKVRVVMVSDFSIELCGEPILQNGDMVFSKCQ